jgi:hypothetical protein
MEAGISRNCVNRAIRDICLAATTLAAMALVPAIGPY